MQHSSFYVVKSIRICEYVITTHLRVCTNVYTILQCVSQLYIIKVTYARKKLIFLDNS